ncbi:glycosyltransferase family 2 protein [Microvirga lenta]|uniref:glycosyltransferase family 2 protein n=1 Tax=Microvirga lenta TaxID=2881337 RepID=UPI001D000999|nr:glycosyltransferase family A protein [Microvirga lenta]MCB5176429.1 glycosyltransferase family 2 protein [Microvirga lenta]
MTVARTIKHIVPADARTLIKKNFPGSVEKVAFGLDSIPLFLNGRAWKRLLQPNPNQRLHPLGSKLWSGFGERASGEIELSKLSAQRDRKVLAAAAWSLAKWYAYNRDYGRALENLVLMTTAIPRMRRNVYTQLMVVECLLRLDRLDEAQEWLEWASRGTETRAEFYFSAANIAYALASRAGSLTTADAERLAWLNRVYEEGGFSKIEKRDPDAPLSLDNLKVANPRSVEATTKLSVLMPAYNCADTLPIALTSILDQTWRNLEVLVVDDRSPDETWQVIQRFAERDNRIIPLRHERNGGAYAARNTALAHATGDFVTVHDADDWSHPEKFAAQMLHALSQPDGISTTIGVRVSMDLRFDVKANMAGMLMENTSSLLVKRQVMADLGGWDVTRLGADSEFYERIKVKHGLATNKLFPATPLTLILFSGSSLTQTKAAGIATVNYGARRQYKEAYRFWHATEMAKPEPDLRMTPERRFPAPRIVLGQKEPIQDIDVVVVGNFADAARPFERDVAHWERLVEGGLKLGLVHWPTYRRAEANIVAPIRSAIATGLIENIVPGESVSCRAAVLLDPALLADPPAPLPVISAERLYVMAAATLSAQQEADAQGFFGCVPLMIGEDDITSALNGLDSAVMTAPSA